MQKHLICFEEFSNTFSEVNIGTFDKAYLTDYADRPIIYSGNRFEIQFTVKVNGKTEIRVIKFEKLEDAKENLYRHYYQIPKHLLGAGLDRARIIEIGRNLAQYQALMC